MSGTLRGWELVELRELVFLKTGPFGSALHKSDYVEGGVPIVNPMHIGNGRIAHSIKNCVSADTLQRLSEFRLQKGDIVLGRRGEMGRCAVVRENEDGWLCGTGSLIVRPSRDLILSDFLQLLLSSDSVVEYLQSGAVGSTMANLNQQLLFCMEVKLPPKQEQTRIVAKLEELLSDLDAGVAELNAAQKKLAQYRQSLLKAAVEGGLTADWRARHTPTESGAQLLARILTERRARWEAKQRAKFAAQGKPPPKGWQAKYPEPVAPHTTDLPALPAGWVWASLGQLLSELTSGSRDWSPYYDRGACTFVMAQNVRPWRPDFSFRQLVDPPPDDRDRQRSEIRRDDILVTIVGANTGQCCRVPDEPENHFVCQSVALLRPVDKELSEFINAVLNSTAHGQRQFREMNYGAGRPHLSFTQLESVLVPLAPVGEQQVIVDRIAEGLASILGIDRQVQQLDQYCTAQRKNLLKAAFAGQLVPQDPTDEPASVLLERIRAERDALGKVTRVRGRTAGQSA